MMLDKLVLAWLCCAMAVPVEVPSAETGWPTYHGGGNLAGVTNTILPDEPVEVWRFDAGGDVYSTPVSDGERIYFSARKGKVFAVDLQGSKVWKKTFTRKNDAGEQSPYHFEAPLAVFHGTVLAGTTRGMLFALDAQTGETQWTNDVNGTILGSPNLVDPQNKQKTKKIIVVDQGDGALHCINIRTGKLLWKTDGVERCDGSASVGNGRIVFGSCAAAMHVYSSGNGKHLRDIDMEGDAQIAGGAVLLGRSAFAGTRDGELVHVDVESGKIIWINADGEDQAFSTPAVTDSMVVYGNDDGWVYALDRKDGKQLWKFDTGGMPTSPVIAKDKVVVTADGVLYLLSLNDGSKLWSKEVSDEISSPAIIGGMIVVGADDGTVTAFGVKK